LIENNRRTLGVNLKIEALFHTNLLKNVNVTVTANFVVSYFEFENLKQDKKIINLLMRNCNAKCEQEHY
jgi:uncharacterized SAM-dependent methyltransferase